VRKTLLSTAAAAILLTAGAAWPVTASAATSGPCGSLTTAPTYTHVIWVWMENNHYDTIIGSSQAPYINSLAGQCGLATNYHNIGHPSLPNYIAGTSGLGLTVLKPFMSDCSPSKRCSTSAPSIFGQGETWNYTTLGGCTTNDVPYTQLAADLANNALPAFSFITPNLIDDMHDGTVADGDNWLAANMPTIFNSPEYQSGSTAVFITWDEGEGGSSNE
jgi:hypothetical protein